MSTNASQTPGAKILLVDDDEDFARPISTVLQQAGYRVRHARDGDSGVRLARSDLPDLVLMDLMMPARNGFDTCHELRGIDGLADIPILAMTAFGQHVEEVCGRSADGTPPPPLQGYLEKPTDPNVLLQRVAEVLAGKSV